MSIESFTFGRLGNVAVPGFVVRNAAGGAVKLVAYGARMTEFSLPDARGHLADVVLGFDTLAQYQASDAYMGATCGRYGGRIRNGRFALDGRLVQLDLNEGTQHAHGGHLGFDRKVWQAETDAASNQVIFTLMSPDGEQGYPGTVTASTSYSLSDHMLEITMSARSDRMTVINMLHHSYWNLAGHDKGDIRAHRLELPADSYLPIDEYLVPTGEVHSVAGTAFDFRVAKLLGQDLDTVSTAAGGYDHNWWINGTGAELRRCASLADPQSGRALDIFSTEPGVQLYTAGHLSESVVGKGGGRYRQYAGVALETQRFPDAPNLPHFPDARLAPGSTYEHRMQIRLRTSA